MTAMFLIDHHGRHGYARPAGIRAARDRPDAVPDPPDQHPGVEHVGEPGAQHRRSRSIVGDWATAQLWLFWVAPIVGASIGAALYRFIGRTP